MPVKRIWDEAARAAFWAKVRRDERGCWIWTGSKRAHGYGTFYVQPSDGHPGSKITHRLAWMDLVGPIPAGHDLDHLCRTPACVNPAHLDPVTRKEHAARRDNAPTYPADTVTLPTPAPVIRRRDRKTWDQYRTHCRNGHEYAVTGFASNGPGIRTCRACREERDARRRR
jgi:hypothetical protein